MRRILVTLGTTATALAITMVGLTAAPANAASCTLTRDADGTWSPVVCADGKPNARIRGKLRQATPSIMMLKKTSSDSAVAAAVCRDISRKKATNPMVLDALEFQDARYGWGEAKITEWTNALINGTLCS